MTFVADKSSVAKTLPRLGGNSELQPQSMTIDNLLQHLGNKDNILELFHPYHWLVYSNYWCPIKISEENLRIVAKKSNILGTVENGKIKSLSFDSIVRAPVGTRFDIWYYGSSTEALLKHLRCALENVLRVVPDGPLFVMVMFGMKLDSSHVLAELEPVLGRRYKTPPFNIEFGAAFIHEKNKL